MILFGTALAAGAHGLSYRRPLGGTVMWDASARQERPCGDRCLVGRIKAVLEDRDLRTLTEDVMMIRSLVSVRTGAAVIEPPQIGSGWAG
jgi:hypothetical protein